MLRWLRFSAIGLLGVGVQLLVLTVLTHFGMNYLMATALAVETAILHNCVWHLRWTWVERTVPAHHVVWRFHLANGAVSILANVLLMRVFAGWLGMPLIAANLLGIAITSALNFMLADRWVFAPARVGSVSLTGAAQRSVTRLFR